MIPIPCHAQCSRTSVSLWFFSGALLSPALRVIFFFLWETTIPIKPCKHSQGFSSVGIQLYSNTGEGNQIHTNVYKSKGPVCVKRMSEESASFPSFLSVFVTSLSLFKCRIAYFFLSLSFCLPFYHSLPSEAEHSSY